MGKRLWGAILFLLASALGAEAQYFAVNGACSLGGQATVMQGMASSGTKPLRAGSATFNGTGVMASYPGCTVTVFQTGTNTPALIYSSAIGGSRSNPFTGDLTDGSWVFFAAAGCYDVLISSGATQAGTMPNSKTFPGMCAGAGGSGGGGGPSGTSVLVNGTAAVPNQLNFTNTLLVPGGSTVVNFLLNGNTVGAYVTGTGGGGGGSLPTTPTYDLFASTGSGGAQTSGLLGGSGFLKGQVFLATGDVSSAAAPFALAPNASVEYFPSGASFGGLNIGATNGLAAYFSHSGKTGASPGYGNGGIMLGGGNSSGTNYQVYVDCESAPALNCDFKVPITVNGSSVGGGGGGGLPVIPSPNIFASNGSGSAVDSGVLAQSGFLRGYVLEATGTGNASPFVVPNGSVEYFPTGGYGIGGANGLAVHFSHSGVANGTSPGWGNGGIALGGGNASGVNYQIYVDCESAPLGCDFKVPVTVNGSAIGGGGGGGITGATANGGLVQSGTTLGMLTTCSTNQYLAWSGSAWTCATPSGGGGGVTSINTVAGAFTFSGAGVSCAGTTCTFSGGGGGGSGTVSSGTGGHFTYYATTGTTVSSNANLDDSVTTAATITSQEVIAAPQVNINGAVGTGIAMTGAGGTLPAPVAGQGGIGIGPGNVPQYYSNGGAWGALGHPIIPVNNLYASNGSGGAQDTNVQAAPNIGGTGLGVIKSGSSLVSGLIGGTSPFTGSNGSQEWYGVGGVIGSVTVPNGAVLIMGNSASTAGPTGNGGVVLGGNSATTTSSKEVFVDCEHTGCDFKAPITVNGGAVGGGGGSGTVSPNNGTITTPLAAYPAAGGSTTVQPSTQAASTTNGIQVNQLQYAANLTTAPEIAIARIGSYTLAFGSPANPGAEATLIRSANVCTSGTADVSFTTTAGTLCSGYSLLGGSPGKNWAIRCVIPWAFTAGSGTANVAIGITSGAVPLAATTYTGISWGTATNPVYQAVTVSSNGNQPIVTLNAFTIAIGTIYTATIDGVLAVGTTTTTFGVYATTSNGTGAIKAGAYCRIQ